LKIRQSLKILPVIAMTVLGVGLSGLPAGALPASAAAVVTLTAPGAMTGRTAVPNSNIVARKSVPGDYRFKPSNLKTTWNGPPPVGTCTKAAEKITITNKSGTAQTLTDQSGVLGTLPKHVVIGLCFWGTASKFVFKFGIEGQKPKLRVHLS
jgi:hypothetical protein